MRPPVVLGSSGDCTAMATVAGERMDDVGGVADHQHASLGGRAEEDDRRVGKYARAVAAEEVELVSTKPTSALPARCDDVHIEPRVLGILSCAVRSVCIGSARMPEFDVAVVGAGPAGSVAAALLAGRGMSVALIDATTFPREKLCGDFISYDAAPVLDYLGVWSGVLAAGATPIERASVVAGRTSRAFELPARSFALSRYCLDAMLVEIAARAGARPCLGWRVTDTKFDGQRHLITVSTADGVAHLKATVVIAAWGRWSRLDLNARRALLKNTEPHFGVAQYGTARPHASHESVDLFAFRGGYVGVVDIENRRANLCGLVTGPFLKESRGRLSDWLNRAAKSAPLLAMEISLSQPLDVAVRVSNPVVFCQRSPVVNHMLAVGDAAIVLPPLIGGGIATAVQTALLAAKASLRLVARVEARAAIELDYNRAVTELLRARTRWAAALNWLLSRPRACEYALRMARPHIIWEALVRQTRSELTMVESMTREWRG